MAMMATPTQEHFRSWSMEKYSHGSSHSNSTSSSVFYDAEEKVRISNTMEHLKAALKEHVNAGFDEEYQSSEEALSPMLQDETSNVEEDEEDFNTDDESDQQFDIMKELEAKAIKVDIAIAVAVSAAGKAHVVNVPQRWSTFRGRQSQRFSARSDSRSPSAPTRSSPLRLNTSISTHSRESSNQSHSSTPSSGYPRSSTMTSMHRTAPSIASATSFSPSATTSMSVHDFLNEDPYQLQPLQQTKRTTKSRLRTVSSKLISSLQSPHTVSPTSDDREIKQQRRRSLIGSSRPESAQPGTANMPFFFSQRSRDEWIREHAQPVTQPRSATPTSISASTPTQKKLPKMVARAADERAPMIELPPCPKDYDQEITSLKSYNTMPIHMSERGSTTNLNMRRRKSLLGMRA